MRSFVTLNWNIHRNSTNLLYSQKSRGHVSSVYALFRDGDDHQTTHFQQTILLVLLFNCFWLRSNCLGFSHVQPILFHSPLHKVSWFYLFDWVFTLTQENFNYSTFATIAVEGNWAVLWETPTTIHNLGAEFPRTSGVEDSGGWKTAGAGLELTPVAWMTCYWVKWTEPRHWVGKSGILHMHCYREFNVFVLQAEVHCCVPLNPMHLIWTMQSLPPRFLCSVFFLSLSLFFFFWDSMNSSLFGQKIFGCSVLSHGNNSLVTWNILQSWLANQRSIPSLNNFMQM